MKLQVKNSSSSFNDLLIDEEKHLHSEKIKRFRRIKKKAVGFDMPELKRETSSFLGENVRQIENLKLYIKNMVSIRCKMLVKSELDNLKINYGEVRLGEVELKENISGLQYDKLKIALFRSGLELMDDRKAVLIEKIKNVIIEMVHYADELPIVKYSDYISEKLDHDYTYLSNTFSEVKGITIQQFIINHKIEKIKELLVYDELSIKEISYKLHYSNVAHLCNQFKKVTGLTPSFFKQLKNRRLTPLDNV